MDDDFWKKAGEAIDAQVKELAEKQAVNTAKQLNESHATARKEMKNETLLARLEHEKYYVGRATTSLIVEAIAEIERLEAQLEQNNTRHMEMADKLKETNHKYNLALVENIRLTKEVERLQAELDNLALAAHSDKDVAIRDDELRDQFACAAMEWVMINHPFDGCEDVAEQAYVYADAMLKARDKK